MKAWFAVAAQSPDTKLVIEHMRAWRRKVLK